MERKLASIQKIIDIKPIDGADSIEIATVLGWKTVVKKGEFNVGDTIVYIEYDSIVPERPEFHFLQTKRYRVKTLKLRGQVSQGLVVPLNILPNFNPDTKSFENENRVRAIIFEGLDVTKALKIQKYEPPVKGVATEAKGNFPEWIKKTDETRIQTAPSVIARHSQVAFVVTEKIDGQSMTVYYRDGEFGVCSRNMNLKKVEGNRYWRLAEMLGLHESLPALGRNLALQGEVYGEGVQGNKYKLKGNEFRLFNVFDIDKFQRLPAGDMFILATRLNIQTVPVISYGTTLGENTVDSLIELSKGKSLIYPETEREGLVFKSAMPIDDEELGDLSFKVINPNFLLKHGE